MINITFTKEQYRVLLKALFWAEWVKNADYSIPDEEGKELQELEQYIFSFTQQSQTTDWITYEDELKKYYPTRLMEDELQSVIDKYDEHSFWEKLIHRMARRDTYKKYGAENIKDISDFWEKEEPFLKKYEEEFVENGIDNLQLAADLDKSA